MTFLLKWIEEIYNWDHNLRFPHMRICLKVESKEQDIVPWYDWISYSIMHRICLIFHPNFWDLPMADKKFVYHYFSHHFCFFQEVEIDGFHKRYFYYHSQETLAIVCLVCFWDFGFFFVTEFSRVSISLNMLYILGASSSLPPDVGFPLFIEDP